jgi:predicted naringenin-chalcone synthase
MTLAICSIGTALPGTVYDQEEGLRIARSLCCRTDEQATWLPTMYRGTQINKRHMVLPRALVDDVLGGTQNSGSIFLPTGAADDRGPSTGQRMAVYEREMGPLAVAAARQALQRGRMKADRLTHLITVTCTGFAAPGFDQRLIAELPLVPTIARTQIGFMGCHGALNGLRVASAFAADPGARVLLCAAELCSLHYFYGWDPGKVIANAIFADGAAALIGVPAAAAPAEAWKLAASGSCVFPGSEEAMSWTIRDNGFLMSLSKKVPDLIAAHLRPWLTTWLAEHDLAIDKVPTWAIHPGGPRIIGAVEEALRLTREQTQDSHEVFAAHGNMSSPTILFILDRLMARRAPRLCVALGFGPGLAVEAALFV